MRRHLSSALRIISIFTISSLAFAAVGSKGNEIKIGVVGPLTGQNAAFGLQLVKGAELAAEEINKKGGINGKMIVLIKGDDACEQKQAVNVANKLVDKENVAAVIGHFCSGATAPASKVYDEGGVLMITPASTNPSITERGLKNVFRTCGRDDQQGTVAADYIVNKLKAKRIALLHDKDVYGEGLATSVQNRLKALGATELLFEGLNRGEKDFSALVTKLKGLNPDVVFFGGLHSEAGVLVRQMHEQGLMDKQKTRLVSGDGIVSSEFVKAAGGPKNAAHVLMTFGRDPRLLTEAKAVVDSFRKGGYEPEGYTLYSYATMQVIAEAMRATKATEGKKLSDWLRAANVPTVMGNKTWDAKGDLKDTDYVMYEWAEDGTYKMVEG